MTSSFRPGSSAPAMIDGQVLRRVPAAPMALAVAVLALLVVVGLVGSNAVAENIVPTAFWLVIWIAVPISCGILGDWTTRFNPIAAMARLVDRDRLRRLLIGREEPLAWPVWLGWWPAVALFF
ncbi:MAG: hypothetical protein ACREL4_08555, partial [Gemmatimonadales bacterium]